MQIEGGERKIIYQSFEAKDWRSIFANYEKRSARYNDMRTHTHTLTRPPHAFAFSISPGDKWWQTVLEIRISCNQWEGSACTHGVPKVFFLFWRGWGDGPCGFLVLGKEEVEFFFLFSKTLKERGKCAGEGNHLTEMNATSLVLHIN